MASLIYTRFFTIPHKKLPLIFLYRIFLCPQLVIIITAGHQDIKRVDGEEEELVGEGVDAVDEQHDQGA